MTVDTRTRFKDNLIIIATSLNIVLAAGAIFGGMNWIARVNNNMETLTAEVADLKRISVVHDADIRAIEKRHAGEDAVSNAVRGIGVR
jgi:hypothetical protein